ncbi:MAG: methylenetetrahydrofolate reductase [NAD(P)H] [Candidatus Nanopelagicales bacterium]|jgi:methylenetetrahydrofolate reductase (NADPH)|nr:methylenetetrahydrofolate reductase [NAD(P)H] [Candidatus Nanopelagicales bacterium]
MSQSTVRERIDAGAASFSFEFFPPKTPEGSAHLWDAIRRLEPLNPTLVSVTYGAGGSTRDRTVAITQQIAHETTLTPMGHLTCVGSTVAELRAVIAAYADAGVHHVLALRGDPPGGPQTHWTSTPGGLEHADELVELVNRLGRFSVGVAAFPDVHPSSPSLAFDVQVLKGKQDRGADFAMTQFFFDVDSYLRYVDAAAAAGVTMPIIPGIMPVTDVRQLQRFAMLSGTPLPDALTQRFEAVADDPDAVVELGVEVAAQMCSRLLSEGAPGLHFYTLNRSFSTLRVYRDLGLTV